MLNRYNLLSSISILVMQPAIGHTSTIDGQSNKPAVGVTQTQDTSAGQNINGQNPENGVADIVVTAQRREETVQKSSLSIEVLAGRQLQNVSRPQDLNTLATGLQIGSAGVNPQVYIRGVGDNASTSTTQSSVTFNVDGIVLPRGSQATTQFFDISRIELLKGPQGTLYGRNASGGIVNIITNAPVLGQTSMSLGLEAGNFSLINADAAVNLPLGKTIALRVAGQIITRDGYTSDGGQDQKTEAVRSRLYWEPSDIFHATLNGDYSHVGGQGSGVVVLPVLDGNPWRSNTAQPLAYPFTFTPATLPYSQPNDRAANSNIWGTSLDTETNLGFATLAIIPAYREQHQQYISYTTNQRFAELLDGKTRSLEARLGNNSRLLKWVVGGFYYRDVANTRTDNMISGTPASIIAAQTRESLAAFGQATFSVTESFRVLGGIRYTDESLVGSHLYGTGAYPSIPFGNPSATFNDAKRHFRKVTWKAGVEFDAGPKSMLYANVSTGTKAGGFDPVGTSAQSAVVAYQPEEVTSYVVGAKNRFFNNRLQINLEAFYLDYKNQQLSALAQDQFGSVSFFTRNVGRATIKGASLSTTWHPTRADMLELNVEYADGHNKDFQFTQVGAGAYSASNKSLCSATLVAVPVFSINCAGTPVARLPKWSGNIRYSHEFELQNGSTIRPMVSATAATTRWLETSYGLNGLAPSYLTLDAELAFSPENKQFTITGWVRNMTNEAVYTSGQNVSPLAPNGARFYTATINPPRTYGIRGRFKF